MMGLLRGTLALNSLTSYPADRAGSRFWRPLSIRDAGILRLLPSLDSEKRLWLS